MKTIKDLSVKVTYRVGLGNLKVPKKVYDQLNEIVDEGGEVDGTGMEEYPEATEWLTNNIRERDCMDIEYEIEELE